MVSVGALAREWGAHLRNHADPCDGCTHPEWAHQGLGAPACSWAGDCVCLRYRPPDAGPAPGFSAEIAGAGQQEPRPKEAGHRASRTP